MGKRELVALLSLSTWCLVVVLWLFLAVPWVSLQFVIVVFPDHTHLLFLFVLFSHSSDTNELSILYVLMNSSFWFETFVFCIYQRATGL